MPCPTDIRYSKIVGTSPAIAEITYDSDDLTGYTMPNFGDDIMIQIDNSIYYGFLFKKTALFGLNLMFSKMTP
jgi:hypothetical protein